MSAPTSIPAGLNKRSNMKAKQQLFLGLQWMVFSGEPFDADGHRHHAAQWAFSTQGAMTIGSVSDHSVTGSSLFVPAECYHSFQTPTPAHLVYWEPEHSAY